MQSIKTGFKAGTPKQFRDLIKTDPWLVAGDLDPTSHDELTISSANIAFTSLKAEFLYSIDPRGPWTLRKQKKTFSDGFVLVGDCDGFAVECLRRCKGLDISPQAMRLIVCATDTNQPHMVSCIETDQGSIVFDCRAETLTDIDGLLEKGYRFKFASSPRGTWHHVYNMRLE